MTAAAAIALITEILSNLPAILRSGQEVIDLVNRGWKELAEAYGDKDVTPEEIRALVQKIAANSAEIQSIN